MNGLGLRCAIYVGQHGKGLLRALTSAAAAATAALFGGAAVLRPQWSPASLLCTQRPACARSLAAPHQQAAAAAASFCTEGSCTLAARMHAAGPIGSHGVLHI